MSQDMEPHENLTVIDSWLLSVPSQRIVNTPRTGELFRRAERVQVRRHNDIYGIGTHKPFAVILIPTSPH
ncbi:hypothetical protein BJ165DRAFT_844077 [Panaeolus papilionaceus]|nr:hypothetical protein BJ165DRAFT_844077 [Panaeolus papilionaceus]